MNVKNKTETIPTTEVDLLRTDKPTKFRENEIEQHFQSFSRSDITQKQR